MKQDNATQLWNEAQRVFPGGVNSLVRAFKGGGRCAFFGVRWERVMHHGQRQYPG